MTLHKLGEPDPEPDVKSDLTLESKSIHLDFISDEDWEAKYGLWRYQCDYCQQAYPSKEWQGFGLSVDDFNSLSSMDVDIWGKLIKGDAHFCDAKCAGQYFLET